MALSSDLSSIMNTLPSLEDNSANYIQEMAKLRDQFFTRIPIQSQTESVRSVWQSLWAKALLTLTPEQMNKLGETFLFAAEAHKDQKRKSGEPYIIHVLSAALILAGMRFDMPTLEAALLHDTLEDTGTTSEELQEKFGADVEMLVRGVTKLAGDDVKKFMSREDLTGENLRRMFIVMARDIRVVLIKLADRLHNMRTLGVMKPEKQQRIARETMEIYAPLAHKLGIYQIKRELEDLSFMYLQPDLYHELQERVKRRMPEMESVIKKAIDVLEKRLQKDNIPCRIKGRSKHYYSIYEKMQRKKLSFDELYDILAVRVLVSDVSTCYAVLGIVHALWSPVAGQFDDYIANPKSNMYQSLHTTVMAFGVPLEVQIRTHEMNNLAEYGIAAHWLYKSGGSKLKGLDARLMWIRQALEVAEDENSSEFMDVLKSDILLTSEVYVFTPQGKPMILPNGATTLDFAYAVHTEVGNHCVGATINGRIVPLNTQLHNGDRVNILTSPQGSPSKDWLRIVSSGKTRSKIRSYFKQAEKVDRDEKLERGWTLIERELRQRGLLNVTQEDFNNIDEQLIAVGSGSLSAKEFAPKLALAYLQHHTPIQTQSAAPEITAEPVTKHKHDNKSPVLVEGEGGVSVILANCCNPVPGDEIVGCSTSRRGITIHRAGCKSIKASSSDRIINVSWANPNPENLNQNHTGTLYTARLKTEGLGREDLLSDATKAIGLAGGSISGIKATMIGNSLMRMKIEVRVKNLEHLYSVMARLNEVRGIMEVARG